MNTVEEYAETIRNNRGDVDGGYPAFAGIVRAVAEARTIDDAEKVERIQAALAALDLVREVDR